MSQPPPETWNMTKQQPSFGKQLQWFIDRNLGRMVYGFLVAVLIALIVVAALDVNKEAYARRMCLSQGYPRTIWDGETVYCVRIEDGDEVVRPLSEIGR